MYLEKIEKENDIKKLEKEEWEPLAEEIRDFLIEKISVNGGHLASNLGVVELTMAIHLAFDLPQDKIIWDVGHQSYTHKILTGRKEGFDTLRKFKGMSGFPKRKESVCDVFDTGHSSTSISAGLGFVEARKLTKENYRVVSVIGDGALTGGIAYEALNNAAQAKSNFIIVLNDNTMSISRYVGGMSEYLNSLRTADAYYGLKTGVENSLKKVPVIGERAIQHLKKTKSGIKQLFLPGMLFEDMGITYLGPVDGHNISKLIRVFQEAKRLNHAVLIHVMTTKGKGYYPAERYPSRFHGAEPFVIETGKPKKEKKGRTYTEAFSNAVCKLADAEESIVAITAAMPDGTGLKRFQKLFPNRFFDVGIAEEHAVIFAAGLAAGGLKPVFAVYSSFLQRAYDQIIHDVCLQNLPVVFAIDRAGLVGSDGETHQGIFDLSFLSGIPGMTIMAPKNYQEFEVLLQFAFELNRPVAIRYPRGNAYEKLNEFPVNPELGKGEILYDESEIVLFAVGSMVETAVEVRKRLKEVGYQCSLVNARFVKPFDEALVRTMGKEHALFVTLEEGILNGGFGERIRRYLSECSIETRVINVGIDDDFVEHGSVEELKREIGLDAESIYHRIVAEYVSVIS